MEKKITLKVESQLNTMMGSLKSHLTHSELDKALDTRVSNEAFEIGYESLRNKINWESHEQHLWLMDEVSKVLKTVKDWPTFNEMNWEIGQKIDHSELKSLIERVKGIEEEILAAGGEPEESELEES